MKIYDAGFEAQLSNTRDKGVAPVWMFYIEGRDRDTDEVVPMGFWNGDDDVTITMPNAAGVNVSRVYRGGVNMAPESLKYVADLTNNSVSLNLSQIAPMSEMMARGYNIRLAYCELHCTAWNKGAFASQPQLQWVGVVDEGPIATPSYGGDGAISLTIRSELMTQYTVSNPAKSSDQHQRRRLASDTFCKYSGAIQSRSVQWYKD